MPKTDKSALDRLLEGWAEAESPLTTGVKLVIDEADIPAARISEIRELSRYIKATHKAQAILEAMARLMRAELNKPKTVMKARWVVQRKCNKEYWETHDLYTEAEAKVKESQGFHTIIGPVPNSWVEVEVIR